MSLAQCQKRQDLQGEQTKKRANMKRDEGGKNPEEGRGEKRTGQSNGTAIGRVKPATCTQAAARTSAVGIKKKKKKERGKEGLGPGA